MKILKARSSVPRLFNRVSLPFGGCGDSPLHFARHLPLAMGWGPGFGARNFFSLIYYQRCAIFHLPLAENEKAAGEGGVSCIDVFCVRKYEFK